MQPPPPTETIEHQYAGVFLVTNSGKVVGQQRDDKSGIDNPGKIGSFGGAIENNEIPLDAAWRELVKEETNLEIPKENLKFIMKKVAWRELTQEWEVLHYYYTSITDEQLKSLEVYEGQGWAYMDEINISSVVEPTKEALRKLLQLLKS